MRTRFIVTQTFFLSFNPYPLSLSSALTGEKVFSAVLGKAGIVERCWYYKKGIKTRPANGSGAERSVGIPKRHCLSHAAGGASCAAWQFRPRGTHRVGLFSLDFLWFFLVSRQERTLKMTLYQNSTPGSSFQNYSAPSGLVKSFAPY